MMESLPTMSPGTHGSGPLEPRAVQVSGLEATDMNGFIGLMTPLLANATTVDQNLPGVTHAPIVADGEYPVTGDDTSPSRPSIAARLPLGRPAVAMPPELLSRSLKAVGVPNQSRSAAPVGAPDRDLRIEVERIGSEQDERIPIRQSLHFSQDYEQPVSIAIAADGPAKPDGERPPVIRLNSMPSDPGSVTYIAKPPDTALGAQNAVAKHAPLPVAQPAVFAERLEQHIAVMLSQTVQHARIAVSPPELGPIEARVMVIGDEANVQLIATQAATREALEDALPRLRSLFVDSGLSLGHADVFTETPGHRPGQTADQDDGDHTGAVVREAPPEHDGGVRVQLGLIDAFV